MRIEHQKHYGCYKVGILFSGIIILLLLVGCVPVFFLTHNNNLILLILLVTLILIGVVTYAYFRWQHRRALQMRRTYEQQKMNLTRSVANNGGKRGEFDPAMNKQQQNTNAKSNPIAAPVDILDHNGISKKHHHHGSSNGSGIIGGGGGQTANQPRYSFI